MMEAILKLWADRDECCRIYDTIVMTPIPQDREDIGEDSEEEEIPDVTNMNASQISAIRSCMAPLSLIWGPPGNPQFFLAFSRAKIVIGTGKTTVVVQILRFLLLKFTECKILMTASTHNGNATHIPPDYSLFRCRSC